MIISQTEQGTPEWLNERRGVPSASESSRIITSKGEPSKSRHDYMATLAVQRISPYVEKTFQSADMRRGNELEPEARDIFAMDNGLTVEQAGFCTSDDGRYGFSPDGLIDRKRGLEIKCPKDTTQVARLRKPPELPIEYFQQVQMSLFVSGYEYWWFYSYYPGLKPIQVKVFPDLEFHIALESELNRFCDELDELERKLRRG